MIPSSDNIKKAVTRSQHCQRNWDLEKRIPEDDMDIFIHAVSNCPSKQNVAYYDVHFITNREKIERIHEQTDGFIINGNGDTVTNSQTLANLLIVFSSRSPDIEPNLHRNSQIDHIKQNGTNYEDNHLLVRDKNMAIGIAAGYINLIASLLGYSTGCCACFGKSVGEIIGAKTKIDLIMGVGFSNDNLNRRIHHLENEIMFPSKKKQEIRVFKHD